MSRHTTVGFVGECAALAHVLSAPDDGAEYRYRYQMSAPALGKKSAVVGNKKKRAVQKRLLRKEKNKIEMNELRVLAMTPIVVDAVSETKDDLGLASDTPLGLQHVYHLLRVLVYYLYLHVFKPVGDSSTDKSRVAMHVSTPFSKLLIFHRRVTNMSDQFQTLNNELPCTCAIEEAHEIQKMMDERLHKVASFMLKNFVKHKYWAMKKEKRSTEEIVSIFNTPDVAYIVEMWEETLQNYVDDLDDPLFGEGFGVFRTRLAVYFTRLDEFYLSIHKWLDGYMEDEHRNDEEPDTSQSTGFHFSDWRKPFVSERKDRSEYERLVQLSKEREAREAEERLAVQREKDAKIAAQREEAAREAERVNQERQDAILRRLERVNLEEIETPDAVAAAKAAETEREAREAKEKAIAESRARKREQKEQQKVKDEAEAKEQEKREHARETAKRIAHGEGHSKRKGNKE